MRRHSSTPGRPLGVKVINEMKLQENMDRSIIAKAFSMIDIRDKVPHMVDYTLSVYQQRLLDVTAEMRPSSVDSKEETLAIWEKCIKDCEVEYPLPLSIVKSQSLEDNDNNLTKFFGRRFGNILWKFVNNMAIFYSGTI